MNLTLFAKKRTTEDGKRVFYNYLSTLVKKTGEALTVQIKFREECGAPKPEKCPMNIVVEKKNANLTSKEVMTKNGEPAISNTLWVSAWKEGEAYIDSSLDDFED